MNKTQKLAKNLKSVFKAEKGFSLIEMAVSLAIVGFIIIALSTLLSEIVDYNKKIQAKGDVTQNMQYATELIKRNIRNASYDTIVSDEDYDIVGMNDACSDAKSLNVGDPPLEVELNMGQGCMKKRSANGDYVPLFAFKPVPGRKGGEVGALFYYDSYSGEEQQLTPDIVDVKTVDMKIHKVELMSSDRPVTFYVELDIFAVDSQGILQLFEGGKEDENDAVRVNTGAFVRRAQGQ